MKALNLNTVLLTIILGLSGWTLSELYKQGTAAAALLARSDAQARELADLRLRVQANDAAITGLRLEIARITR